MPSDDPRQKRTPITTYFFSYTYTLKMEVEMLQRNFQLQRALEDIPAEPGAMAHAPHQLFSNGYIDIRGKINQGGDIARLTAIVLESNPDFATACILYYCEMSTTEQITPAATSLWVP